MAKERTNPIKKPNETYTEREEEIAKIHVPGSKPTSITNFAKNPGKKKLGYC